MKPELAAVAEKSGAARRRTIGDPIKESIPYMLQVTARLQTATFMTSLVGTNVHPAESYVVHELWKASPLSQSDISARLGIGNATVGKTLQRLEKNGFVQRTRESSDARRVMVRLTDKGVAVHEQFDVATQALMTEIDAVLGPVESRRLLASLNKLADHFRLVQTERKEGE